MPSPRDNLLISGALTMITRDLLRATLRHRPGRILVGEVDNRACFHLAGVSGALRAAVHMVMHLVRVRCYHPPNDRSDLALLCGRRMVNLMGAASQRLLVDTPPPAGCCRETEVAAREPL